MREGGRNGTNGGREITCKRECKYVPMRGVCVCVCVCERESLPPSLSPPSLLPSLHLSLPPSLPGREGKRSGRGREGRGREGGEEWIDRGREREIVSQSVNTYL